MKKNNCQFSWNLVHLNFIFYCHVKGQVEHVQSAYDVLCDMQQKWCAAIWAQILLEARLSDATIFRIWETNYTFSVLWTTSYIKSSLADAAYSPNSNLRITSEDSNWFDISRGQIYKKTVWRGLTSRHSLCRAVVILDDAVHLYE